MLPYKKMNGVGACESDSPSAITAQFQKRGIRTKHQKYPDTDARRSSDRDSLSDRRPRSTFAAVTGMCYFSVTDGDDGDSAHTLQ